MKLLLRWRALLWSAPGYEFVSNLVDATTLARLGVFDKKKIEFVKVVGTWWWWKNDLVYFLSMTKGIYRDT